jgi:DNA modification methylase
MKVKKANGKMKANGAASNPNGDSNGFHVKEDTQFLLEKLDVSVVRKAPDPRNILNDLNSTEWIPETVSVWNQRGLGAGHPDAVIERQHPAPFSFTDVSRLVRFFTKQGGTVLDPFCGVGSTLKACALEGRKGIGFELNPQYAKLAKQRLTSEVKGISTISEQKIEIGDARQLSKRLEPNSVDFVVTSPPYWNILHKEDHKARQERKEHDLDTRYSDDVRDLGNIHNYQNFLDELAKILRDCAVALKAGKYMAVIVSDFRDKSKFVMFHADLAAALAVHGLELRAVNVLYQRHKKVFPYGYPFAFVPNIHHQFILILQKGRRA